MDQHREGFAGINHPRFGDCEGYSFTLFHEVRSCSSSCLSDVPFSVFHAVSPFALPPWITAAAPEGLANSASLVKTNKPSLLISVPSSISCLRWNWAQE